MVLATVALGTFMATLDSSIVNIALPTIRRELNAGDNVEWIILSYLLITTSTLLVMGKLSDMFGRKNIYIAGFSIFVAGSLFCGLSWDIWSLVASRIIQGLGASMMFAIGPAIVSDTFLPAERGKALGLMGTVVAAGSSTGPVVGGLLLGHFGWQSIFFVNVPIGLIAIWRAAKVLSPAARVGSAKFDIPGAVLFCAGVSTLLIGVDSGTDASNGWTQPHVIALLATGLTLLALFLYWENRTAEPMLRLRMFRIKPFTSALSTAGLGFMASGANIYILPFFLQLLLGFSPQQAGLILLAGPLTLSIAAPIGGYLSDKISTRWIASAGLLITSAGYFFLSFLQADWTAGDIIWRLSMLSLGFGLFQSPNSSSALNAAPILDRGVASSLISFVRNLGMVLGIALGAAVWYGFRDRYASGNPGGPLSEAAQVFGMQKVYLVTCGLVFCAALISVFRGDNREVVSTPEVPVHV
ncbi:MAG: DHA2 family efflux MFS transporter permease subunit [Chitinophagaceae bacterium]|nr:MAG: DHA2 family efflux MFS transporter permease subunit [Chitinophagaceae bacterium]